MWAVVATTPEGVIGRGGGIPWRLGSDLRRFRRLTWGKPLLMGRRTFESIGGALPGRVSIVLSRGVGARTEGVEWAVDYESGVARGLALGPVVVVAGGEALYRMALADRRLSELHLTVVEAGAGLKPEAGDARFPVREVLEGGEWVEVAGSRERVEAGARDEFAHEYAVFRRRREV